MPLGCVPMSFAVSTAISSASSVYSYGGSARAASAATNEDLAAPAASKTSSSREQQLQDPAVQRQIAQLAARDREVRAHEQAHIAAGGGLITSGPNYVYQSGPDGKRYAVGGEVGIDTSPVRGDPEATIAKAGRIRNAALAPAEPSAQDQRVAAQAGQMEQTARGELSRLRREEAEQAYASAANDEDSGRLGLLLEEVA